MKNKVCSVMNSNVKAYFTIGQRGTVPMLARRLIFACVLVLCQACFAQASGNLPKLTPAQQTEVTATEDKLQQEMTTAQKQMYGLGDSLSNLHKPLSDKDLTALGKKYRDLSIRYFLLMNRMMAMSQGHLLFSDHPKVKQSGPSIHKLVEQLAKAQWQQLLLARQGIISPPKTAQERTAIESRLNAINTRIFLLTSTLTAVQHARYGRHSKKERQNILSGAARLFKQALAVPGKVGQAAYGAALNAGANLIIATTVHNDRRARVKGEVVDPSGKPLNGVKMVVIKNDIRGLGRLPDKRTLYAKTINGHFNVSASGFNYLELRFYKYPWRPVELSLGSNKGGLGVSIGRNSVVSDGFYKQKLWDLSADALSAFMPCNAAITASHTHKGHTWTVRVVLPAPLPQVTLINYPGQVSEDATGHGDAITLSTADRMKSQLTNVNLTKPNKLPLYTFYVTFKRDSKGQILLHALKNKFPNMPPKFIPQEFVMHITGKQTGLHINWYTSSSGNNNGMSDSKGPYQSRILITAKDLLKQTFPRAVSFDIKADGRYGYGIIRFTHDGCYLNKGKTVVTLSQLDLHIQQKNYGTRYVGQ
ncbi:MAG: hypothetical protein ACP5QA_15920 [Phycisphaerae bacterium]